MDISSEKLDRTFQYLVPESMENQLQPGMQVRVPVGNGGRTIKGYVIQITDRPSFELERMKEIPGGSGCLDEESVWLHHDSGIEDGTSCETEDETEGRTLDHAEYHSGKGRRTAGVI